MRLLEGRTGAKRDSPEPRPQQKVIGRLGRAGDEQWYAEPDLHQGAADHGRDRPYGIAGGGRVGRGGHPLVRVDQLRHVRLSCRDVHLRQANRVRTRATADAALGAKARAARSRLDGRCVKTIVFKSPKRAASRVAARNEPACRNPTTKKTTLSSSGARPNFVARKNTRKLCTTKPPPKLSSAKRPARRRTTGRDRRSGPVATSESCGASTLLESDARNQGAEEPDGHQEQEETMVTGYAKPSRPQHARARPQRARRTTRRSLPPRCRHRTPGSDYLDPPSRGASLARAR